MESKLFVEQTIIIDPDERSRLAMECNAMLAVNGCTNVHPFTPPSPGISVAARNVLSNVGLPSYDLRSWHLLRSVVRGSREIVLQDLTKASEHFVCMLFVVSQVGQVTITSSPNSKKHVLEMHERSCVIFKRSVSYSLGLSSSAVYVHCVCAPTGESPIIKVATPVKFACPYKRFLDPGDVRAYPKNFVDNPLGGSCPYSAVRWKNVLDHLVFCKLNPNIVSCRSKQAQRRELKAVAVRCHICGRDFSNSNSFAQHKRRVHRAEPHVAATTINTAHPTKKTAQVAKSTKQGDLRPPTDKMTVNCDKMLQKTSRNVVDLPPTDKMTVNCDKMLQQTSRNVVDSPLAQINKMLESLGETSAEQRSFPSSHKPGIAYDAIDLPPFPRVRLSLQPLGVAATYDFVRNMLAHLSKSDIVQPSGRTEQNTGEMSMVGVSLMIDSFDAFRPDDVFVDVGGGIGNVVFQVALQTRAQKCISLEARGDLVSLSQALLNANWFIELRLDKVSLINIDITKGDVSSVRDMQDATHLFSHNTLFTSEALLALEEMAWLPKLRFIAVTLHACPRHRPSCSKPFCQIWALDKILPVPVTYKHACVDLYIYKRRSEVSI